MATTASETQVQKLYISYFGRPADPSGLAFYADALDAGTTTVDAIATSFAASTEAQAIVALGTDAFLAAVYQQAFARTYVEATDGTFWKDAINNGLTTKELAMVQILEGAQNTDVTAVDNKVTVAKTYTAAVTSGSKDFSGDTAAAAAKAVLTAVTSDTATVTSGNTAAQSAVDALNAASGGTGTTFTLTTGVDSFTGTTGDDSFVASDTTLTILDSIDGGAGVDTLAYTDASNNAFTLPVGTTTITGIETFTVTHSADAIGDSVTVDTSTLGDARTVIVTNVGTAAPVTVTGSANLTAVTISGGSSTSDVTVATVADAGTNGASTTDKIATVTLTGLTGVGTLSSEALTTLNLNAAAGLVTNTDTVTTDTRALTVNYAGGTNGGVTDAGATSVTVNVTGATTAAGTNTFAAATTANLTANAVLTAGTFVTAAATDVNVTANAAITAATVTAGAATTLDLSGSAAMTLTQTVAATAVITNASTGAVTLNTAIAAGQQYVGGAGVDTVTFAASGTTASTLGAGDDVATFSAVASTGGSVDAGGGTDTVSMASADAATLSAATTFEADIANFERLSLAQSSATETVNLANLDDINYVTLAGVAAAVTTITISNFATAGTFEQTALVGAGAAVSLTGAFTGASDTFTLAASATNGFVNGGTVTLADVETVAITLDDTDTTAATTMFDLNFDATAATTVTVTGDAGITFANSSLTAVRTVDASGVTATGAAGVVTFTANAGMDTAITGGAGNDVLTGNTGNDTITGGAGTDALVGAAGTDTISGGDGVDTITGGTGADSLTGGAGNDIFVFADGDSTTAANDSITDYTTGDVIRLTAGDNVAGASAAAGTAAATNVQVDAGGKVTFAAADDTLAEMLVALAADTTDIAADEVVFFEFSGDTYIFNNVGGTDDLVKLVGVTGMTTLTESTTTAGDFSIA